MGLPLLIIASFLKLVFAPIAYTYGVICSLFKREFNKYNTNLAIAKDQYGNALCEYMFNQLLIRKNGYKFGNRNETISAVLGRNKKSDTLTSLGRVIVYILNKIEKDHVEKAVDNSIK